MLKYIVKRLVLLIPVLIGVVTIVFILNQLMPGDPARMLAGEGASEEAVEQLREEMGLNQRSTFKMIQGSDGSSG